MRRTGSLVALIWLCFVVRGFFYSALLPVWEGYDEPLHFAFVEHVSAHRALPLPTDPVSREAQESLHLLPLSWEERLHGLAPPLYTHDSYWQLSESSRQALQEQVRALPPEWGAQRGTAPVMYEAQQGPLYYWLMAWPLRVAWQWSLPAQVVFLRALSVLLTSLCVPIAYLAARRFFGSEEMGLGVIALLTCMPELMIDISRVSNEALAIPLYSLLTLLLLLAVQPGGSRWMPAAGAVLGLGLLTKAYFALGLPALVLLVVYTAWRWLAGRKRALLQGGLGLALAVLISCAWYWRNRVLTGAWSGQREDAAAAHYTLSQLVAAVRHVNWLGGVTAVLVSHVWFGAWSFLKLSRPVYVFFALGMAAAACGLVRFLIRERLRNVQVIVAGVLYGFFWVGLLYDMFVIFVATGVSASNGWYMYAVVVPELLLVTLGLAFIVPARWRKWVLPSMTAAFAAIDIYGVHALLVPYYTGLIAHTAGSDLVKAARLGQLAAAGPHLILNRLAVNKPALVTPTMLAILFLLYCLATAVAVTVAFVSARSSDLKSLCESKELKLSAEC